MEKVKLFHSDKEKKFAICTYKKQFPKTTLVNLARHFERVFNLPPSQLKI